MRLLAALAVVLALATTAEASTTCDNNGRCTEVASTTKAYTHGRHNNARTTRGHRDTGRDNLHAVGDPRPRAWCAWWLRRYLSIPIEAFHRGEQNLARAFRYIGRAAGGPAVGAIVVWPHHVGVITGKTDTGYIVKSGNDGHAVRERERSLRGAIAYRWP